MWVGVPLLVYVFRPEVGVRYLPLLLLLFETRSLTKSGAQLNNPLRSVCLHNPTVTDLQAILTHLALTLGLRIQTQVLMLAQQVLYPLSKLPNPSLKVKPNSRR